jgi:Uma2 family endonuclease
MTGMKTITPILSKPEVVYPESDDEPIAENTKQYEYIVTVKGGLDAVFRDEPNIFVAADLFWYPVKGNNKIRTAPDTMVVFGRPKGHRGSYLQWKEADIAPQTVFEILSPGNRVGKLAEKFEFYDFYGVEEYYVYDPDEGTLAGWLRRKKKLVVIKTMEGWISPRLKVRFELQDGELCLFGPDGKKFATYAELVEQAARTEKAEQRAAKLAAQLKALGVEPEV